MASKNTTLNVVKQIAYQTLLTDISVLLAVILVLVDQNIFPITEVVLARKSNLVSLGHTTSHHSIVVSTPRCGRGNLSSILGDGSIMLFQTSRFDSCNMFFVF
jgi:hypothetical protein